MPKSAGLGFIAAAVGLITICIVAAVPASDIYETGAANGSLASQEFAEDIIRP